MGNPEACKNQAITRTRLCVEGQALQGSRAHALLSSSYDKAVHARYGKDNSGRSFCIPR